MNLKDLLKNIKERKDTDKALEHIREKDSNLN